MKHFDMKIKKRGVEQLVVTISAQTEDGRPLSKDVDLGGNATTAAYWGAFEVIKTLQELDVPKVMPKIAASPMSVIQEMQDEEPAAPNREELDATGPVFDPEPRHVR
jgi:hypothetical protein